jgi:hypothetical protein
VERKKSKSRIAVEIALRVVVVSVLFTLVAFAVGLLCGIIASVLYAAVRGAHADLTMAYRFAAVPLAAMVLVISFVAMLTTEIRRTRRLRLEQHT